MEAVKLAPTLVPAAVLAAKFESEAHQVRRAMRIVETAWLADPHPDLADAYAHVRLGDSARQRLVRVEALAVKTPGHIEGALAIARAAIDAAEFGRAREALKPFLEQPTQRVAILMSELERTEHSDSGRARAWTLRAVRARHDAVWTADGYISDRWRPMSPVTGRIDAFRWQAPVAALPSDRIGTIDISPFEEEALLAAPVQPRPSLASGQNLVEPPRDLPVEPAPEAAAQDNTPPPDKPSAPPSSARDAAPAAAVVSVPTVAQAPTVAPAPAVGPAPAAVAPAAAPAPAVVPAAAPAPTNPPPPASTQASIAVTTPAAVVAAVASSSPPGDLRAPPPMFRARADLAGAGYPRIPSVIPIVRAPDDPGIDDEPPVIDEFAEQLNSPKFQSSGWRGFWSRFGD
jgi:HemY protein